MPRILLLLTIALLPFQIRLIIPGEFTYFAGLFNEYASYAIHISDLTLLLAAIAWSFQSIKKKEQIQLGPSTLNALLITLIIISAITSIFAKDQIISAFQTVKMIEGYILYLLIINKTAPKKEILFTLLGTFSFQSILAIIQFISQSHIGLHILGEPKLISGEAGIATVNTPLGKIIRAYGTLPHPNVLAGGISLTLISTISLIKEKKNDKLIYLFLLLSIGLITTLSRTAWLATAAASFTIFILKPKEFSKIISKHRKKLFASIATIIISVLVIWPTVQSRLDFQNSKAATDRMTYAKIASNMIKDQNQVVTGVGPANFTLRMQEYADKKLKPWDYQPVHNIFLLNLVEKGIFGFIIIIAIFIQLFRHSIHLFKTNNLRNASFIATAVALTIIASLDHYLADIHQGIFMFWICIAFISKKWYRRFF